MATLATNVSFQCFGLDGKPLAGGKVYTYSAGTTTNKATYTTMAGPVPNSNPVILDQNGKAKIFLGDGSYRLQIKDSNDALIDDIDQISRYVTQSEFATFQQTVNDGVSQLTEVREQIDVFVNTSIGNQKGFANGIAPLDANVKIDPIYLPALPSAEEEVAGISTLHEATQGVFKKLKISSLGINNYTSAITADSITLRKSTGESYLAKNVNVSPQIISSGANGLDAGSVAANTWYYLYLISDGTLVRGLFSLSATAPTLPNGYTYFARVGAVRTGASGYLLQTLQQGRQVQYVTLAGSDVASLPILLSGAFGSSSITSPTYVAISTSNVVPPTASKITGVLSNASAGTTSSVGLAPNSNYSGIGTSNPPLIHAVSGNASSRVFTCVLETSNIYAYSSTSAGLIQCLGWEDNL